MFVWAELLGHDFTTAWAGWAWREAVGGGVGMVGGVGMAVGAGGGVARCMYISLIPRLCMSP